MADNGKKSSIANSSSAHLINIKRPGEVRQRLKLVFQRISARMCLKKNEEELSIALALIDLSVTGAGFFTSRMLSKGTPVELIVADPIPTKVSGSVVWCTPMQSGMHILKFPFRAGVKFSFATDEERQSFSTYIERLSKDHSLQANEAPAAAPAEEATPAATPAAESAPAVAEAPAPAPTEGEAPAATAEEKSDEKKAA